MVAAAEKPATRLVRLMSESRVSGVPVIDRDGRLVGIVTEADLLLAEEGERKSLLLWRLTHPKRRRTRQEARVRASDIMTRQVITAPTTPSTKPPRSCWRPRSSDCPWSTTKLRVVGIVVRKRSAQPYLRTDEEIRTEITEDDPEDHR